MKRKHEMPFGAECCEDGTVRFHLWAPNASSVDLHLAIEPRDQPMLRLDAGWFELVAEAHAGTQYRFNIDHYQLVPDPASRFQASGVHGASEIVDPCHYEWGDDNWRGRPWDEAVIYELHVGTFTPKKNFSGALEKLDYLAEVGVTAIELMPLASFPGDRDWGYDGVLPYAPASCYGRPEDVKQFVDAAHARNLMVFLDVVYNHLGPEGNYLSLYAPQFFSERHHTPWGKAINFDGPCSRTVRDFFIHNALYWLEEYHLDGLRLDAVHAIIDDSEPDVLTELAVRVKNRFNNERHVHLVLENADNEAHYLDRDTQRRAKYYTAQWNDDIHHALHVLLTGEKDGYYSDYANNPAWHLGRCLVEGFSFQRDRSPFHHGETRGEPSRHLPPEAFVSFLQNHDQIGNRALGERIIKLCDAEALRMGMTILLLAPSPPMLFMGEEFGATTPFLFFCDFGPELAEKVKNGRRAEFARFEQFNSAEAQAKIPDPNSVGTFLQSKLDWNSLEQESHRKWLQFYREVLTCRRAKIIPRIKDIAHGKATFKISDHSLLEAEWPFSGGGYLKLLAHFGRELHRVGPIRDELLYVSRPDYLPSREEMPALTAAWFLNA